MDRNEWSRRQLGSDNVGRPVSDPLGYGRYSDGGNAAPKFTSTAVTSVVEDVAYTYNITVTDADLDTLTITATTKPDWLTFTDNTDGTATLTGTPDVDDVGDHAVTINVNDGTTSRNQHFTITVTSNNNLPVFSSTPVTTVDEDSAYNYSITVTDADPDTLVITAPTKPDWLTFTDNTDGTATLTGTPDQDDVGTHSVVLSVTDGEATVTQSFDVTVSNVNDAPVFTSTAPTEATEDEAYSYAITVTDEDGDTLTITAPTKPAWLTLVDNGNGTATLSGTPADTDAGDNAVVLSVTDGTATVTQSFTIDVDPLVSDPVNSVAPSIAGAGYAGRTLTATAGTWDTGTATGQWYADGVAISGETGSTYVVSAANNGAAFKYIETNGGITAESNVIHHAVPTDIGVQRHYDWTQTDHFNEVSAKITQTDDLSGNDDHLVQNSSSVQGTWNAADGSVTIISSTKLGLTTSLTFTDVIIVCTYDDGVSASFASTNTFLSLESGFSNRIAGLQTTADFNGSGLTDEAYINGAAVATSTVLPLEKSVIRFRIPVETSRVSVMSANTYSDRGLIGDGYAFLIAANGESDANMEKLEGIMAWSHGIEAKLDASHPYKSSPPTV